MLPNHCRHVSLHKVKFDLTEEDIKNDLMGSKIYKGTDYLILNNRNDWSVVKIEKTPKKGLFWLVTGIRIISLPKDTVYLEDPEIDVLNKNMMGQIAKKKPNKLVVVKGAFEHVSFIKSVDFVELFYDWKAATKRNLDGDIRISVGKNQKRFGYSDDIKSIMENSR